MIQRCWSKTEVPIESTEFLEIWDGGSKRYERWPDGTECCWEVIDRVIDASDVSSQSFTEVLKELPSWNTPAAMLWTERVPFCKAGENTFQIPGWSITYSILPELDATIKALTPTRQYESQRHTQNTGNYPPPIHRRHFHKKRPQVPSGSMPKPMKPLER